MNHDRIPRRIRWPLRLVHAWLSAWIDEAEEELKTVDPHWMCSWEAVDVEVELTRADDLLKAIEKFRTSNPRAM